MIVDADVGNLVEIETNRRWDRAEVQHQVALRVRSYRAHGLEPGDRALIHFGNRPEFFAELLAIWTLGGCAIPVDARLTAFELETLVKTALARFSVIDDRTNAVTREVISSMTVVDTLAHDRTAADEPIDGTCLELESDALILFTSGSTGDPKGVVHTHRSLRARWMTLRQSLGIESYRHTLCLLPTHFGHGLICNCLYPWLAGCDLFIAPPFDAGLVMKLGKLIDEHEITFLSSVPSMWNLALPVAKPPKRGSLKRIHVGSAPLSQSMWERIQEWSGINEVFNAYGITETGSWVAGTTGGNVEPADGLIGEPWGATIKILTARSVDALRQEFKECAPEEIGMIWLNTPALMKEYFKRPDLTSEVVYQGWFMTGDIGTIDVQSRLYIRGRERDEINKGGMKVFPADIDAVAQQFDAVVDVCTFGIDDDLYGQNVAIALVMSDRNETELNALFQWLASRLADHKQPVVWYVLEEIPRTSRGKINRENVRDLCTGMEPLDLRQIINDSA